MRRRGSQALKGDEGVSFCAFGITRAFTSHGCDRLHTHCALAGGSSSSGCCTASLRAVCAVPLGLENVRGGYEFEDAVTGNPGSRKTSSKRQGEAQHEAFSV